MNDRRRFLHVLGATTAAVALPACGGTDTTTGSTATGAGGAGGDSGTTTTGGMGGAGGTGATASSTDSATASSSASTGGSTCEMNPVGTPVGVPDDFGTAGLHILNGTTKILIGRDDKGLYALTSICPHEFCDMDTKQQGQSVGTVTAQGITCNCHNSKFDNYGAVTKGPATKPLKAYQMALGCDGKIYVDKTKVVSIDQRLNA
jgi:nitrite reductase/ring-hydroxylating ferredoxin subunit